SRLLEPPRLAEHVAADDVDRVRVVKRHEFLVASQSVELTVDHQLRAPDVVEQISLVERRRGTCDGDEFGASDAIVAVERGRTSMVDGAQQSRQWRPNGTSELRVTAEMVVEAGSISPSQRRRHGDEVSGEDELRIAKHPYEVFCILKPALELRPCE